MLVSYGTLLSRLSLFAISMDKWCGGGLLKQMHGEGRDLGKNLFAAVGGRFGKLAGFYYKTEKCTHEENSAILSLSS